MRAVRVPAAAAVTEAGVHYVVAAVNSCLSVQAYRARGHGQALSSTAAPSPEVEAPLPAFRLASLLPVDWSALLRVCRRLTHPEASFNFFSPGDTADTTAAHVGNRAYLHIVERVPGDFTPNNMIYHALQQYHITSRCGTGEAASQPTSVMGAFTKLVTELQEMPAVSTEDVSAELLDARDTALAAACPAEKLQRDSLASQPAAQDKSRENANSLRAYTAAAAAARDGGADTHEPAATHPFTFYPHPIAAEVSIPYCSAHFCVLVNLKPIVPHHLMVVPIRCVGTMHGLTEAEVEDWGHVMQCTIQVLEHLRRSAASACAGVGNFSIAVQQGAQAGQTVDHLHVHVIPFDPRGKLAGEPETDEAEQRRRPPRTAATMRAETEQLRPLFTKYAAAAAGGCS